MPFTIPNDVVGGTTRQRTQATLFQTDIDILVAGLDQTGVVVNCAVTAQASPNMTVAVASGTVIIAGTLVTVTGANVTITPADGSHPRLDLIVSGPSGSLSAVAGTPGTAPAAPALPASSAALALVYVDTAVIGITTTAIVDKRVFLPNLNAVYLSLYNGSPEPERSDTVGATTYTPNLGLAGRFKVTTTGNPTITMPTIASGDHRSFWLMLINDGTGGYGDPTWDAKVSWVGLKSTRRQTAASFDLYYFESDDNLVWLGYHITARYDHGADYDQWTKMTPPGTPAANSVRQYVDTADTVMKIKDQYGEAHWCEIHVSTTAPTNTAIPWLDIT